jgi:hypothetical protein
MRALMELLKTAGKDPSEMEATLLVVQLASQSGSTDFLERFKADLFGAVKPSESSALTAALTYRALCVVETSAEWLVTAEPPSATYRLLGAILSNAQEEDVGVLMQAVEGWIAIIQVRESVFILGRTYNSTNNLYIVRPRMCRPSHTDILWPTI